MRRGPKIYELSTRVDPERGGPVANHVRDPAGLATSGCRHLLMLVHGFNNTEKQAKNSYLTFFALLEEHFRANTRVAPDAVALLHWPGNHAETPSWGNLLNSVADAAWYHIDILRAQETADRLAEYFIRFARPGANPGALRVTLVGHSLGCRLILEMLEKLVTRSAATAGDIEVVSLMAPAVPVDLVSYTGNGNLRNTVAAPRKVLKMFSERDDVLWGAFPLGQLMAYERGIEESYYSEAVGFHGNPVEVGTPFPTTNGHGEYWSDRNAADKLSAAIDPTFYRLPAPRELERRSLAAFEREGRDLPGGRGLL